MLLEVRAVTKSRKIIETWTYICLQAILKHSQRAGLMEEAAAIEQAFHVMTVVPNQANDMMDIGRLQGFEVDRDILVEHLPDAYLFI